MKVVKPLPPRRYPFLLQYDPSAIVRPKGFPSRFEPPTFGLGAQCLIKISPLHKIIIIKLKVKLANEQNSSVSYVRRGGMRNQSIAKVRLPLPLYHILSAALHDEILKARNNGKFVLCTVKADRVSRPRR